MGVGKSNIEYSSRWEDNTLILTPRLLSDEDLDALNNYLSYLEDQVGKPRSEYNSETALKILPVVLTLSLRSTAALTK